MEYKCEYRPLEMKFRICSSELIYICSSELIWVMVDIIELHVCNFS